MDLKPFYKLWYEGMSALPIEQQKEIRDGVDILDKRRPSPFNIAKQKFLRKYGLVNLRDYLRAVQSRFVHQRSGRVFHKNIFAAAGATDSSMMKKIQILKSSEL